MNGERIVRRVNQKYIANELKNRELLYGDIYGEDLRDDQIIIHLSSHFLFRY